jgi:hypothetical protein
VSLVNGDLFEDLYDDGEEELFAWGDEMVTEDEWYVRAARRDRKNDHIPRTCILTGPGMSLDEYAAYRGWDIGPDAEEPVTRESSA